MNSVAACLHQLNHTELYQSCCKAGLKVNPSASRIELIEVLLGDRDSITEAEHAFDTWRYGIIGFLLDHWTTLEPQITCPAKYLKHHTDPNPRPCFGCLDTQVVCCLVQNEATVGRLIEIHKLKRTER